MKLYESFKKIFNKKFLILILITLFTYFGYLLYVKYNTAIQRQHNMLSDQFNEKLNNIGKQLTIIEELENKIAELENTVERFKSKVSNLANELLKLQNQNPIINENNLKIIVTMFTLQNKLNNNDIFITEYEMLKNLTQDRPSLYTEIIKLENYKKISKNDLLNIFKTEHEILFRKDKTNNKVLNFFKDNISIRNTKIIQIDKQENSLNFQINTILEMIENNNFNQAINSIKEFKLEDKLTKTLNNLEQKSTLEKIINNILHLLY